MAFISTQFLVFALVTAGGWLLLPSSARWIWLLGASLVFYGWAEPVFLIQILAATAAAYWFALRIEAQPNKAAKQKWLTPGIVLLVANLVAFKYTPFFNESLRSVFGLASVEWPFPELKWLLPIGISFYTFQLVGYLIDVFRGQKAERDLGIFALFVTFFPKLVAGPIERAKNLLPQMHAGPSFSYDNAVHGLQLILWGVIQKAVIADRIAPFVDYVYNDPAGATGPQVVFATFLYAFQIYADFAGYTNIALGIALFFGYRLTQNFNKPYFAVSIQDFWKRWHISLSSWLTDYVYTPLTRQKMLKIKLYDLMLWSLLITFVISGFWHGANWTYIAWGALHGTYIVISLLLQKRWNGFARHVKLTERPMIYQALKISVTFVLVCFAYILFRAATMGDAVQMISAIPSGWGGAMGDIRAIVGSEQEKFIIAMLGVVVLMGADFLGGQQKIGELITRSPVWRRWSLYYAAAFAAVLFGMYAGQQQFIYFRF